MWQVYNLRGVETPGARDISRRARPAREKRSPGSTTGPHRCLGGNQVKRHFRATAPQASPIMNTVRLCCVLLGNQSMDRLAYPAPSTRVMRIFWIHQPGCVTLPGLTTYVLIPGQPMHSLELPLLGSMSRTARSATIACLMLCALTSAGCSVDLATDEAVHTSSCSVLSEVSASAGGSISGNSSQGELGSYALEADGSASFTVRPPSASACGNEMAQRIQGLCALCDNSGPMACERALELLFDIRRTPIEACAACGDGVCSPGESARRDQPNAIFCPEDCGGNCGDGQCTGLESFTCPEGAPLDVCVPCPQDCTNSCGNGVCDPGEASRDIPERGLIACPEDCGTPCGDGVCGRGENPREPGPDNPLGCPQDCARCGNGVCEGFENPITCPQDCAVCGDGICSTGVENLQNCPQDCAVCGDGICTFIPGVVEETVLTCPRDCEAICGDGICSHNENAFTCPRDCATCGNGVCDTGETVQNCPQDCGVCGDGLCTGGETRETCPEDCPQCGNGVCEEGESAINCPQDCSVCGDGICSGAFESVETCPQDCAGCGDGLCDPATESAISCPQDCG